VTTAGSANESAYIALFILMLMGSVVACFVSNPSKVIRARVIIPRQTTFIQELNIVVLVVKREPWIILFFPYGFAGLWYIPYQSNDFNAYFFDLRTRAFGSLWFDWAISHGCYSWDFARLEKARRSAATCLHWLGISIRSD